jgi:hypothetical protein
MYMHDMLSHPPYRDHIYTRMDVNFVPNSACQLATFGCWEGEKSGAQLRAPGKGLTSLATLPLMAQE